MTKTQTSNRIKIHGPEAFAAMHRAGQLTATALDGVNELAKPGITTEAIDDYFMDFAATHKILPATLNYRGYRKACCTDQLIFL